MKEMIDSYWKPIGSISEIEIDTLIYFWEMKDHVKTNNIQFVVNSINENIITARKMAINGNVLHQNERRLYEFTIELLIDNNANYLYDGNRDKEYWPKNLKEAIYILKDSFVESELIEIKHMKWQQFVYKFNSLGGLGLWIRNKFGLWRGNFDLLVDCKIDDINSDNASMSILYHFWEFIVYED